MPLDNEQQEFLSTCRHLMDVLDKGRNFCNAEKYRDMPWRDREHLHANLVRAFLEKLDPEERDKQLNQLYCWSIDYETDGPRQAPIYKPVDMERHFDHEGEDGYLHSEGRETAGFQDQDVSLTYPLLWAVNAAHTGGEEIWKVLVEYGARPEQKFYRPDDSGKHILTYDPAKGYDVFDVPMNGCDLLLHYAMHTKSNTIIESLKEKSHAEGRPVSIDPFDIEKMILSSSFYDDDHKIAPLIKDLRQFPYYDDGEKSLLDHAIARKLPETAAKLLALRGAPATEEVARSLVAAFTDHHYLHALHHDIPFPPDAKKILAAAIKDGAERTIRYHERGIEHEKGILAGLAGKPALGKYTQRLMPFMERDENEISH